MKKTVFLLFSALLILTLLTAPSYSNGSDLILFDNRHYYNANRCGDFIADLKAAYPGKVVLINSSDDFTTYLPNARLFILPNPSDGLTDTEISDLRNFVSNGGYLIVMGDWYNYIKDDILNEIVEGTSIEFTKTEIKDDTHYDYRNYYPLMGIYTPYHLTETIAGGVTEDIKANGAMLNVNPPAVVILKSYDTAYVVDENGVTVATGAVPFVAISYMGSGIVIAIGGTKHIYTSYFYEKDEYGNKEFMMALVDWLYNGNGYVGFRLKDRDGSHPISGMTIKLDGLQDTTDESGITAFSATGSLSYEIVDADLGTIASGSVTANKGAFLDLQLSKYDINAATTSYDVKSNGTITGVTWNAEYSELNINVDAPSGKVSITIISDAAKKPVYVKVDGKFIAEVDLADFDTATPNVWCYDGANDRVLIKVVHSSTKKITLGFKSPIKPVGGVVAPVSKIEILSVISLVAIAVFATLFAAYKFIKKKF